MEWWVYLLVFLVLVFSAGTIFFSFIYPNKINQQKLASDRKRRPHKIILSPENVNLFLNFRINDLDKTKAKEEYQQSGVYGFYVDKKIRYQDDFYPIYLAKAETNVWEDILTTKQELLNSDEKFQNVYVYLEENNLSLDKIHFFIVEDYNLANFDYWKEVLESETKGFNTSRE